MLNCERLELMLEDWSWAKMIKILSEDDEADVRRYVTCFLRRMMVFAFRQLRDRIENPDDQEVTWDEPRLRVVYSIPWEWIKSMSLSSYLDGEDAQPEIHEELIPFTLLTAGSAVYITGDMEYPDIPLPLIGALFVLPDNERITWFNEWFNYDRWMDPVSYGDETAENGTIVGVGRYGAHFRAALKFSVSPWIIDENNKGSYFEVWAEFPWKGKPHPDTWAKTERDVLWRTVIGTLEALVQEAEGGPPCRKKMSTIVPPPASGRNGYFHKFSAILEPDQGKSFPEKASLRLVKETTLDRFPSYALGGQGPILNILDDQGAIEHWAILEILSVMLYPGDRVRREQFFTAATSNIRPKFPEILRQQGVPEKEHAEFLRRFDSGDLSSSLKRYALSPETTLLLAEAPSPGEMKK